MKRVVQRPFAKKRMGGFIILNSELLKVLKDADAVEVGKITVGAKQLRELVRLVPSTDILIKSNGHLEMETIDRVTVRTKEGHLTNSFRKPKRFFSAFTINNKAWLPELVKTTVVLKPRKY
jgi:hypothetical protein